MENDRKKVIRDIVIFCCITAILIGSLAAVIVLANIFIGNNETMPTALILIIIFWLCFVVLIFDLTLLPLIIHIFNSKQKKFGEMNQEQITERKKQKEKRRKNFNKIGLRIAIIIYATLCFAAAMYTVIYLANLRMDNFWDYIKYLLKCIALAIVGMIDATSASDTTIDATIQESIVGIGTLLILVGVPLMIFFILEFRKKPSVKKR